MSKTLKQEAQDLPIVVKELLAGGLTGGLGKTCVAPLERCKILFQTGRMHGSGVWQTLSMILKADGPAALFRGNGAAVLRIVPYSAIHFGLYEVYRRDLLLLDALKAAEGKRVSPIVDLFAGAGAGATAVLVTYPLDLVRTQLAFVTEAHAPGSAANAATPAAAAPHVRASGAPPRPTMTIHGVVMSTLQREGVRGLYRGVGPSMYGILPYAGLKFCLYQGLKNRYHDLNWPVASSTGRLPIPAMLSIGAIAGLVAQTVTYPLDVVRRKMQVQGLQLHSAAPTGSFTHSTANLQLRSTMSALAEIVHVHGWRALFAGLSINYLKVIPSTAIGFTLYDMSKEFLGLSTHL